MQSHNLFRFSTWSHVFLIYALKHRVACCCWRCCCPALNQIFFFHSGFHKPRKILVQRMTHWPKSPMTAGAEERRKCLSWGWKRFGLPTTRTVLLKTWHWRWNPLAVGGSWISLKVLQVQVWEGYWLLSLFVWLASYMSCFWCSYSFVSASDEGFFLALLPCKTLWWVSSYVLTKFVLKLSLAHTHLLSFFPCHSTLQNIVSYGASQWHKLLTAGHNIVKNK